MRNTFLFIATLTLSATLATSTLLAETHNVSPSGQFKSISAAANQAAPGDTVIVAPGNYDELITVSVSGIKQKPITIKSSIKHKAIVKGFIVKGDFIVIDGFEITNDIPDFKGHGINAGEAHYETARKGCTFTNNYIHDITGTAILSGEHALVKDNLMKNVGRGLFINSNTLVENNEVDTLLVQYQEKDGKKKIKKTQYSFYAGQNITFRGNYFHGAPDEFLIKGLGVDFFVTWDLWIIGPSNNILIENNRCFDATHASEPEANKLKKSSHITFRNNLFVNTVYVGLLCKNWTNITIENNTFINCGAYPIWFQNNRETQGAVVKNNLIAYYKHENRKHGGKEADSGIRNKPSDTNGTIDCDYNMFYNTINPKYGPNDFTAEPIFVDPDNGDFRLKAGSPGIDTGMNLLHIKTDQNGISRPQGNGYDVGAYELKQ